MDFYNEYQYVVDSGLILMIMALSQYVLFKAGIFSLAPIGLQALSAYTCALLQVVGGWDPVSSALVAIAGATVVAFLLALPISRLRGVYQAVATLAFVVVVQSLPLLFPALTGGTGGVNGIPHTVETPTLLISLLVALVGLSLLNRSRVGTAFEAVRLDEVAAASHGVPIVRFQVLASTVSGVLAGLAGVLLADSSFSIFPETFGFQAVVNLLTYVVIGGVALIAGPLIGTAVLVALPEVVRFIGDQRAVVNGLLLVVAVLLFPDGVSAALLNGWRALTARWRAGRAPETAESLPTHKGVGSR